MVRNAVAGSRDSGKVSWTARVPPQSHTERPRASASAARLGGRIQRRSSLLAPPPPPAPRPAPRRPKMLRLSAVLPVALLLVACWPGSFEGREFLQANDCVNNSNPLLWPGYTSFVNLSKSAGADFGCESK